MKTKAVRLYGVNDLRLEEFDLPAIGEDELLAKIVTDTICMSTYKGVLQGAAHKRIPSDIAQNPIITGHEFCGELVQIGAKWKGVYHEGEKFVIQPALNIPGNEYVGTGFSFPYIGGDATYVVIPAVVMQQKCLFKYEGDSFYSGSLGEPISCIIAGFHVMFHNDVMTHTHEMGIKQGGKMALLASAGPMGMEMIDYALHGKRRPSVLVVTDINEDRLNKAASIFTPEEAAKNGVSLIYINTARMKDPVSELLKISGDGFDDVFVLAAVKALVEQADRLLGQDGCMNFFAGPTDREFSAGINFYNVHYTTSHVSGNSGSNNSDLQEALTLMGQKRINPSCMITHICGLDSAVETTLHLPQIPGGKKLIYTHISLPLTAIDSSVELGREQPLFRELDKIVKRHNGLWNAEAEKYLLAHANPI